MWAGVAKYETQFRSFGLICAREFEELETNSKNKNIRDLYRGINDFKKGYQPRCNIVKER